MLRFRKFYEEFRTFQPPARELLGIFKNPTKEEILLLQKDVRAIITPTGDLYVANTTEGIAGLHGPMGGRASELFNDKKIIAVLKNMSNAKKGITMERILKTNVFAIGETENQVRVGLGTEKDAKMFQIPLKDWKIARQDLKKLFQKAKKKNPHWKFLAKFRFELPRNFDEEFRALPPGAQGVYLNPTPDEMKKIPADTRALATHKGDLFVVSSENYHGTLSRMMMKVYPEMKTTEYTNFLQNTPKETKKFVPLIRDGKTTAFYVGGSSWKVTHHDSFGDDVKKMDDNRKRILKKVKAKNKGLFFFNKPIDD